MEYYSAMRKEDTLPFAATWMDFKHIMLSKTCQTDRQVLYDITLVRGI